MRLCQVTCFTKLILMIVFGLYRTIGCMQRGEDMFSINSVKCTFTECNWTEAIVIGIIENTKQVRFPILKKRTV